MISKPEQQRDADKQLEDWAAQQGYWNDAARESGWSEIVRTGRNNLLLFGLMIVGGIAASFFIKSWNERPKEPDVEQFSPLKLTGLTSSIDKQVVTNWLESQRKGRSGTAFWSTYSWITPVRFYAVRSWEIVDSDESKGEFIVRIESSTKAGIPIIKLWKIQVGSGRSGYPKINSVSEAIPN